MKVPSSLLWMCNKRREEGSLLLFLYVNRLVKRLCCITKYSLWLAAAFFPEHVFFQVFSNLCCWGGKSMKNSRMIATFNGTETLKERKRLRWGTRKVLCSCMYRMCTHSLFDKTHYKKTNPHPTLKLMIKNVFVSSHQW